MNIEIITPLQQNKKREWSYDINSNTGYRLFFFSFLFFRTEHIFIYTSIKNSSVLQIMDFCCPIEHNFLIYLEIHVTINIFSLITNYIHRYTNTGRVTKLHYLKLWITIYIYIADWVVSIIYDGFKVRCRPQVFGQNNSYMLQIYKTLYFSKFTHIIK